MWMGQRTAIRLPANSLGSHYSRPKHRVTNGSFDGLTLRTHPTDGVREFQIPRTYRLLEPREAFRKGVVFRQLSEWGWVNGTVPTEGWLGEGRE